MEHIMATTTLLDTLAGGTAQHDKASSVRIVPYNAVNDTQADAMLPYLWKRMQQDDLVDYYFPGQSATGFSQFVRLFSGDGQVALVVTDSTTGQWNDTIAGFISWTPSLMGMANVIIAGFIFFRQFWDHHTTDEAGAQAFNYWFKEAGAQVVLGVCPSELRTALRYNKRIGLKEIGRIPNAHLCKGSPCDAVLVAITRDEWSSRGHEQCQP